MRACASLGAFGLVIAGGLSSMLGAPVVARAQSPGYLSVILGRTLYSKADECQTPSGMMTIDQVVPLLAAMGITVTAPVIPNLTLEDGVHCVGFSRYPSWTDLGRLRDNDGLTVVSATQGYDNLPTLATDQQFRSACGSLATIIAHGNHRAWGLLAYPDNEYTTAVETHVVSHCFAFGRTYVRAYQPISEVTNAESAGSAPGFQVTINVGGGRCNDATQACSTSPADLGRYTSPVRLASLVNVAVAHWTAMQFYSFVTGSRSAGSIRWDCSNSDWREHWTSQYEVYCWRDFLSAMEQIPASVVVTDPATVAEAWGRVPVPLVAINSVDPASLRPTDPSTTVTWHAYEDGTYTVLVNAANCVSGTPVASGDYSTGYPDALRPSRASVVVPAADLPLGEDAIRVCLTNDAGRVGSTKANVDVGEFPPIVTGITPSTLQTGATGITVTIDGSGFESDGKTITIGGLGSGVNVSNVTFVSSTRLTAKITVSRTTGAGAYDVTVTSLDDPPGVCSGCLTIRPGPVVLSMMPNVVRHGRTYTVTVSGQYFAKGASVIGPAGVTFSNVSVSAGGMTLTATMRVAYNAPTGSHLRVAVRNPPSVGSGRGSADCLTIRT